jgi:hypothetical protein
MTETQHSARTLWIDACRTKMIELDARLSYDEVTELAEALWNRTSVRALGAIATALKISACRRRVHSMT